MRRRVETWLVRLTEWIREVIPGPGWCISEWAICDFQWGDGWWARKGDNRWGAGTARGLNRDQIVKIARLTGCKNFVGKRKKLLDNYIYIITYQQYQLLTELLISTINIIDIINRLNSYINNLFNANMNWQSVNWIVDITISNYCYGQW